LGQFVLVNQLGRGGFAPVWLAREEYAGRAVRVVALKCAKRFRLASTVISTCIAAVTDGLSFDAFEPVTIPLPRVALLALKLTQTGSKAYWWSITEVNLVGCGED